MKRNLLFLLLFPTILRGQQLATAAGGTLQSSSGATVSYSIGEIAIATLTGKNSIATQGMQQPLTKKPLADEEIVTYNGITLNDETGDGLNDVFFIDSLQRYPNNRLIVLNRWQETVFDTERTEAKTYKNGWRGTTQNGNPLPMGTYYYLFYPKKGERRRIKGSIAILR
jgi:gliding motility-associated-like protein